MADQTSGGSNKLLIFGGIGVVVAVIVVLVVLFVLPGGGGVSTEDRAALLAACMQSGTRNEQQCNCQVDHFIENASEEDRTLVVGMAQRRDDEEARRAFLQETLGTPEAMRAFMQRFGELNQSMRAACGNGSDDSNN